MFLVSLGPYVVVFLLKINEPGCMCINKRFQKHPQWPKALMSRLFPTQASQHLDRRTKQKLWGVWLCTHLSSRWTIHICSLFMFIHSCFKLELWKCKHEIWCPQSETDDVFTSDLGSHVTLRRCQSVRPNIVRSGYCVKQGNVVRPVLRF